MEMPLDIKYLEVSEIFKDDIAVHSDRRARSNKFLDRFRYYLITRHPAIKGLRNKKVNVDKIYEKR